jgi:hypothetical protein
MPHCLALASELQSAVAGCQCHAPHMQQLQATARVPVCWSTRSTSQRSILGPGGFCAAVDAGCSAQAPVAEHVQKHQLSSGMLLSGLCLQLLDINAWQCSATAVWVLVVPPESCTA